MTSGTETIDRSKDRVLGEVKEEHLMADQIIADLKYVDPLKPAPDWRSFAANGAGGRADLNRVLGQAVETPLI